MASSSRAAEVPAPSWATRAADRSPTVQRSRTRSVQRAKQIVAAARRLVDVKGGDFTTHELVKEAGVAVQTFYKHFSGKDQVLLAVIEDVIAETVAGLAERGRQIADPVARLRFYVTTLVSSARVDGQAPPQARFITTQHWRLHQLFPDELAAATRPVTDLFLEALHEAAAAGLVAPSAPDYDAWLAQQLIQATFHYYAFASTDDDIDLIAERIWAFCLAGFGGRPGAEPRRRTLRRSAG